MTYTDTSGAPQSSNSLPMGVAPAILTTPAPVATANASGILVMITCNPKVQTTQSISLALGSTAVPAQPSTTATDTLSFQFPALAAGPYWPAFQVDGAENFGVRELVTAAAGIHRTICDDMRAKKTAIPWNEANQAYLVAEFSRLKHRLAAKSDQPSAQATRTDKAVAKARKALKEPPAIDRLSELLGLSAFERQIVLLCAGVEMDSKLATQCAEAQGHAQRPYATFGLAMAIFPDPHWSALTPSRPLRRFRLVEVETGHGLTSAPLRIDERILHYLAGVNLINPRLESLVQANRSLVGSPRNIR